MNILCHITNFLIDKSSLKEETYKVYHNFDKFIEDSQQTIQVL